MPAEGCSLAKLTPDSQLHCAKSQGGPICVHAHKALKLNTHTHTHTHTLRRQLEVLHLFRCFTHTHTSHTLKCLHSAEVCNDLRALEEQHSPWRPRLKQSKKKHKRDNWAKQQELHGKFCACDIAWWSCHMGPVRNNAKTSIGKKILMILMLLTSATNWQRQKTGWAKPSIRFYTPIPPMPW